MNAKRLFIAGGILAICLLLAISINALLLSNKQQHIIARLTEASSDIQYSPFIPAPEVVEQHEEPEGVGLRDALIVKAFGGLARPIRSVLIKGGESELPVHELEALEQLSHLTLIKVSLNEEQVDSLAKCQKLYMLDLIDCELSGKAVQAVARHPTVVVLKLHGELVVQDSLPQLEVSRTVRHLALMNLQLNEGNFPTLVNAMNIIGLQLSGPISDGTAIKVLESVPKLERLSLRFTDVTDAIVPALGQLNQARYIDIRDTSVSDNGRRALESTLPLAQVIHEELPIGSLPVPKTTTKRVNE